MKLKKEKVKIKKEKNAKHFLVFSLLKINFLVVFFAFATACLASAQTQKTNVQITVVSLLPPRVKIEGQAVQAQNLWSFRENYAGVNNLSERMGNIVFTDDKGNRIVFKKLAAGEYQTADAATKFSYEVRLEPPQDITDSAYVSWLTAERGLLLPNDLLPIGIEKDVQLKFILPAKWQAISIEKEVGENSFETDKTSRAVFAVGEGLRKKLTRANGIDFTFAATGEWMFTDEEATAESLKVLIEHKKTWGGAPSDKVMLLLFPFPKNIGAVRWSAETRGSTVILLSGKMPAKLAALLQLYTPLTHELFHLWLPNTLSLDGQYDWFYEGFTLYQALRAGMRLNYFSFEDYLKSLERAFDAYQNERLRDKFSLVDSSRERWSGANELIYNKGMLTAFLYDLTLRQKSKNKLSLDDVFRELYKFNNNAKRRDGNTVVIETLSRYEEMKDFVTRFIEKPSVIDLQSLIAPFGLTAEQENGKTVVKVKRELSRSEHALLKDLGYNVFP